MINKLKNEPVRIYTLAVALLALASHYVEGLPTPLILAVVAAAIGSGEVVRSKVAPMPHITALAGDLEEGE